MKHIYLIRHWETEYNREQKYIWWRSDHLELNWAWIEQARLLWVYLKENEISFDKIFASVAVRAKSTAKISLEIAWMNYGSVLEREDITELSQWDWTWLERDKIYTPERIEEIKKDNWNFKAPNWESQKDVEERMLAFLNDEIISDENENWNYAVYTHWLAIKCLLRGILLSDPKITYRIEIDNTSITKITHDKRWFSIDFVNHVPHFKSCRI